MALMSPAIEEEEDGWFGEGSSFDSGEDLAAALMELAGTPVEALAETLATDSEERSSFEERAGSDLMFEMLRPQQGGADATVEGMAQPSRWASVNQPQTWSVRTPGSLDLPARKPGKTGWSIRSSVQLLQRTEEVMLSLREEAVSATLVAAARAVKTAR